MNFYANVTDEKIHLSGPIQTPAPTAEAVAAMLERDVSVIDLEMTRMGGGFGRRLYSGFVLEAAEISDAIKISVRILEERLFSVKVNVKGLEV